MTLNDHFLVQFTVRGFAAILLASFLAMDSSGQTVLMRDLTRLNDVSVIDFGGLSIKLSNGQVVGWDQVLRADVSEDGKQADFDTKLKSLGLPMARLNHRLNQQDWVGAGLVGAELFPDISQERWLPNSYSEPSVGADQCFLISVTAMHSWLDKGQQSSAFPAFLATWQLHPMAGENAKNLASDLDLATATIRSGYEPRLLPVWFDMDQLSKSYHQVQPIIDSLDRPPAGLTLYLASMEAQLGEAQAAQKRVDDLQSASVADESDPWSRYLIEIVKLHIARTSPGFKAETSVGPLPADRSSRDLELLKRYLLHAPRTGEEIASISASELRRRALNLLSVAAVAGSQQPVLSAATIDATIQLYEGIGDRETANKLRLELLRSYPSTYHARRAKQNANSMAGR